MKTLLWRVMVACVLVPGTLVLAHDPGLSGLEVQLRSEAIRVTLSLALADSQALANSDLASGTALPQADSLATNVLLAAQIRGSLTVLADGIPAPLTGFQAALEDKQNVRFSLSYRAKPLSTIGLRSALFQRLALGHRQFLSIRGELGEVLTEKLLSSVEPSITIPLPAGGARTRSWTFDSMAQFIGLGIRHILTGYDHLVFLVSLLILTPRFSPTLRLLTCFTAAHSITLALVTLKMVAIPSRIVEPLIAASIVYVGLENLTRKDAPGGRCVLTFAFGLIHGLGLASVLGEMGVGSGSGSVVVPLVSFNLGVEAGQVLFAAAFLPLAGWCCHNPIVARRWVLGSSALVTMAGSYWLIQRLWA